MEPERIEEKLEIRTYGAPELPTVIYLPGVHGDWTMVGAFRRALGSSVRFVELAYPRTTSWTLADFGAGVLRVLNKNGITTGWLLGESFGSQVTWAVVDAVSRKTGTAHGFKPLGIILSGGFAKHPMSWGPDMGLTLTDSRTFMKWIYRAYLNFANFSSRQDPETQAAVDEFMARRDALNDHEAIRHRLQLVADNDPGEIIKQMSYPLFCLTGFLDPVVPWPMAFNWFKTNCATFRDGRVIYSADHNVLGTAPEEAAAQVLEWMKKDL